MGNDQSNDRKDIFQFAPEYALCILEYSDWDVRGRMGCISRRWREFMTLDMTYRWMCRRLSEERGIYSSMKLRLNSSWKRWFLDMFAIRKLWDRKSDEGYDDTSKAARFKVSVYTRFRPNLDEDRSDSGLDIVLPLHQKLGLIRISHNVQSRKDALRILKEEGAWFGKKWSDLDASKENTSSNVQKTATKSKCIQNIDVGSGRVIMVAPDVGLR